MKPSEKTRYFSEVDKLRSFHDDITKAAGVNVWAKVVDAVADLVPEWDVCVASEGPGQQYFSGIIRKINSGVPIHCDWCPYDTLTEDWVLAKITHQAVFNLYVSPFTRGGATTIFDVQWSPDALRYRDPATYGYYEDLVRGRDRASFQPEMGDLYLFNSRNMHTVAPLDSEESVPRVAMASFFGLLPSEVTGGKPKLIFWS